MKTNLSELSGQVVDAAFLIHSRLGPGLLESVYEELLAYELAKRGLKVERQVSVPVFYDGLKLEMGFSADLIVEGEIIVELKSVENVAPVHKKQLLTYLKVSGKNLGLLINFGAALIKDGITRVSAGAPDLRNSLSRRREDAEERFVD